jgi:hypothetical protein
MVLHAGKHSMHEPWVMILDLEGRLELESPWSIAYGDEVSCCLQHHLLLLINDLGDILRHPPYKNTLSISHESKKEYLTSVPFYQQR